MGRAATKSTATRARASRCDVAQGNQRFAIEQQDALAFLRSLPDGSVDLICTDPAYNGMNQHLALGKGRIVGQYGERGDGARWFDEFDDSEANYREFLEQCARVLRDDRHMFLMFDSYSLLTLGSLVRDYLDVKNLVVWDKVAIGMGHYFRRTSEMIVFASKGKRPVTARDIPDIWPIQRVHRGAYPTQKPVELFEAMIAASVGDDHRETFVVCDPFVGSGSSALAAARQRCSFVGADIAEAAIDSCRTRLDAWIEGIVDPLQPKPAPNRMRREWWRD
jgi:site-specific DNA-methyltransferase (adenine-specific)